MHIPDGFLNAETAIAASAVSFGSLIAAVKIAQKNSGEKDIPLMGVTAAFIFAAQMINFPVAAGTSGHFLGAFLAMLLLGSARGFIVMSLALIVQCLGFADGGITALGANIFNMVIAGGVVPYFLFRLAAGKLQLSRPRMMGLVGFFAWLAVMMASVFCALELHFSGITPLVPALFAFSGIHAIIGIGEFIITTAVLTTLLRTRPDIVAGYVFNGQSLK